MAPPCGVAHLADGVFRCVPAVDVADGLAVERTLVFLAKLVDAAHRHVLLETAVHQLERAVGTDGTSVTGLVVDEPAVEGHHRYVAVSPGVAGSGMEVVVADELVRVGALVVLRVIVVKDVSVDKYGTTMIIGELL